MQLSCQNSPHFFRCGLVMTTIHQFGPSSSSVMPFIISSEYGLNCFVRNSWRFMENVVLKATYGHGKNTLSCLGFYVSGFNINNDNTKNNLILTRYWNYLNITLSEQNKHYVIVPFIITIINKLLGKTDFTLAVFTVFRKVTITQMLLIKCSWLTDQYQQVLLPL